MKTENPESIPLVLSVQDVAKLLCIGKNTAYGLVNSGELRCIRVGRQIRISRSEMLRYLGITA